VEVTRARALRIAAATVLCGAAPQAAVQATCTATVYLTLDTGNMAHADVIAATLNRHAVQATFFLANEPTARGDDSLGDSWSGYWKKRVAEGHAFGTHTWRHGRLLGDDGNGGVQYRPQFGADSGRTLRLSGAQFCDELRQAEQAFRKHTGRSLDALWRAPGGVTTVNALRAAQVCGYAHVHWSPAGFLGDELPSEKYPNAQLLEQALRDIRDGDVLMAHLGIWSRKDPFAPMLDPLIGELKRRGFCFRPLTEHPRYAAAAPVPLSLPAHQPAPGRHRASAAR
jgi:peptidoglycan/xylan/chitin deacetylase (PgdA/CDA1 family)